MHSSMVTYQELHLKQLKDLSHNVQNRRSGKIASHIIVTYRNSLRPHGCHIHNRASDMAMKTMCPCPSLHHVLTHCKYVFLCYDICPSIFIPIQ